MPLAESDCALLIARLFKRISNFKLPPVYLAAFCNQLVGRTIENWTMNNKSGDHQEPFLINAATGSASAGYQQGSYQRGESKIEEEVVAENGTSSHRGQRGSLRRRYRRRSQPEDEEEGKQREADSPRDGGGAPESKEDDDTPVKPARRAWPSRAARPSSAAATQNSGDGGSAPRRLVPHAGYIRKPDETLRDKFRQQLRSVADIPEVHFIGEVTEGLGFKDTYVSCKWYLEWGKAWSFLAGDEASQTQYAATDDCVHVWNHPIDVHFATASMQGWPRIILQAWELDEYGRSILSGYGFSHLPTNPGYHELEVHCWRPSGSLREELQSFFLGTSSCLVDEEAIFGSAWEARSALRTVSSGVVRLNVHVLSRHGVNAHA